MTAPTTRATPKIALDQRAASRHDNAVARDVEFMDFAPLVARERANPGRIRTRRSRIARLDFRSPDFRRRHLWICWRSFGRLPDFRRRRQLEEALTRNDGRRRSRFRDNGAAAQSASGNVGRLPDQDFCADLDAVVEVDHLGVIETKASR
jgi:hypothetical protein